MILNEIILQLKSGNPKARREAARALGETQDPLAVEPLLAALAADPEIRLDILWALGQLADPRAVNPIIPYLSDRDWHIRAQSAESLGQIGARKTGSGAGPASEAIVPALINALPDPQENVFWKISFALGEIGDRKAVDPLLALVSSQNCPRCWQAAWALGRIGDKRATTAILPLLRHQEIIVRKQSVMSLKMLRDPAAVGGLLGLLDDTDWEIRQYATEALVEIGPAAIPEIENRRNSSDSPLRKKLDWIIETIREES